eukprot:scaffold73279_cov18-Tisochrysis_lutea.AAC.2
MPYYVRQGDGQPYNTMEYRPVPCHRKWGGWPGNFSDCQENQKEASTTLGTVSLSASHIHGFVFTRTSAQDLIGIDGGQEAVEQRMLRIKVQCHVESSFMYSGCRGRLGATTSSVTTCQSLLHGE